MRSDTLSDGQQHKTPTSLEIHSATNVQGIDTELPLARIGSSSG